MATKQMSKMISNESATKLINEFIPCVKCFVENLSPKQKIIFGTSLVFAGTSAYIASNVCYSYTEDCSEIIDQNGVVTKSTKKSTKIVGMGISANTKEY